MPISRFDLIAAAANFTLVNTKRRNAPCDEDNPVGWNVCPRPDRFEVIIYPNVTIVATPNIIMSNRCLFQDARDAAADFIASFEEMDSAPLRIPWNTAETYTNETEVFAYWPEPEWALDNGFSADALLYSAAQKGDAAAVRLYLNAGADPLVPTFEGDCAARLGIAKGMVDIFDRPDWINAIHSETGETGMFHLVRTCEFDKIKQAYRLGADPDIQNKRGESVMDRLSWFKSVHEEVEAIIADRCARRLHSDTRPALSRCSSVRTKTRL